MFSAEDECVDLEPTLYPTGNVENWLLVVENSMKNTGAYCCVLLFTLLFMCLYTRFIMINYKKMEEVG